MTFKFEILILGQQMRMDINNFEFIYFWIMDEFHPMIYLFNLNHKWNSSIEKWHSIIWNHSSMDIFIHVGAWKSHLTLNSKLKFYAHTQAIICSNVCTLLRLLTYWNKIAREFNKLHKLMWIIPQLVFFFFFLWSN